MLSLPAVDIAGVYERIKGRRLIYFDNNVWIDLAEAKTDDAAESLRLARVAREAGLVVFPVSYPAVIELLRQPVTPTSRLQAELMDELSEGLTIRAERHVVDLEVLRAYEYLIQGEGRDRHDQMFTTVISYLADGSIEFPDGWSDDDAHEFVELFRQSAPGVRWMQEHLPLEKLRTRYADDDRRYLDKIATQNADLANFQNPDGSLNAAKLRREEHTYVLKTYVIKRLPRLVGLAAMGLAIRKFEEREKTGKSTLATVIAMMPSTNLSCELHVQKRMDRDRRVREQDWHDHEHAVLGVPFCDVFITSDGELVDLLRRSRKAMNFRASVLKGLQALRECLGSMLEAKVAS
jgi:hypothetical protein